MSLFYRLLRLSGGNVPTEDALTEVTAHLFRLDAEARGAERSLVVRWLREAGALDGWPALATVQIDTQRSLAPLVGHAEIPDHEMASRPDLVVEATADDGRRGVVFVESKVGSTEGNLQLRRYAEHLDVLHGAPGELPPTLVYLTRDPDPKEDADVLVYAPRVRFVRARWHGVYGALSDARAAAPLPIHSLYDDVLAFLSALDMNHSPRFTPADALALSRIPQTIRFLSETLTSGAPSPLDRFRSVLGSVSKPSLAQVQNHTRYPIYKTYGPSSFEVLMGYQFQNQGFPEVYLGLGSTSLARGGGHIAQTVQTLGGEPAHAAVEAGLAGARWRAWEYPDSGWAGATVSLPIEPLLVGRDHAEALRGAFSALLNELERVMALHPDLPWDAPEAGRPPFETDDA